MQTAQVYYYHRRSFDKVAETLEYMYIDTTLQRTHF